MEHTTTTSTLNISTSTTSVSFDINTTFSYKFLPAYSLDLTGTSCCMSIFGAILIAVTYCLLPEIQNFPRKLLLYLTIADLLNASGNLMGTIHYALSKEGDELGNNSGTVDCYASTIEICVIQSFIKTFSSMASFFWTVVISVYIYTAVVYPSQVFKGIKAECVYHLLSWGIPGVITIRAVALNALGEDNSIVTASWCWIRSDLELPIWTSIWMILAGKGWEILCYVTTMTLYCLLKLKLWHDPNLTLKLLKIVNASRLLLSGGKENASVPNPDSPAVYFVLDIFAELQQNPDFLDIAAIVEDDVNKVNTSQIPPGHPDWSMKFSLAHTNYLMILHRVLGRKSIRTILPNLPQGKVNDQCYSDTMDYLDALNYPMKWAIDMFNATGNIPSGLQKANVNFLGSYDQCLEVHTHIDEGVVLGNINKKTSRDFDTRYCRVSIPIPDTVMKRLNANTHGVKVQITWGVCVSKACHSDDVKGLFDRDV